VNPLRFVSETKRGGRNCGAVKSLPPRSASELKGVAEGKEKEDSRLALIHISDTTRPY